MGGGSLPPPPKPPAPPGPTDAARKLATQDSEDMKRRGYASTILTGNSPAAPGNQSSGSKTILGA